MHHDSNRHRTPDGCSWTASVQETKAKCRKSIMLDKSIEGYAEEKEIEKQSEERVKLHGVRGAESQSTVENRSRNRRRFVHFGENVIDPLKEKKRVENLKYKVKLGSRVILFAATMALLQEILNRAMFNGKNMLLYYGLYTDSIRYHLKASFSNRF